MCVCFCPQINGDNSALPGIWLDAGVHCREWLGQATAVHILETILTDSSAEAQDLRDNYRIYIAPNMNPDGYVYTWTTVRMTFVSLSRVECVHHMYVRVMQMHNNLNK